MPEARVYGRLENERAVLERLREMREGEARKRVYSAICQGGEVVAAEARRRAPLGTREPRKGAGTGRLRASIKVIKRGVKHVGVRIIADYPANAGTRKRKTAKQAAGSKEYYAFAVEYGTRHMKAQPFLNPALAAKAQDVQDGVQAALEELTNDFNGT